MTRAQPVARGSGVDMALANLDHPAAQSIEVPLKIPTPNTREHPMVRHGRVKKQRHAITLALQSLCVRPPMPVVVTLTRVAQKELDDDNLAYAFKAVRDAIACWLWGLPDLVPIETKNGPAMRAPHAPDGAGSRITWVYAQTPAARGYQAARIRIEASPLSVPREVSA